jgi:hypothetical protein
MNAAAAAAGTLAGRLAEAAEDETFLKLAELLALLPRLLPPGGPLDGPREANPAWEPMLRLPPTGPTLLRETWSTPRPR